MIHNDINPSFFSSVINDMMMSFIMFSFTMI